MEGGIDMNESIEEEKIQEKATRDVQGVQEGI